MKILAFDPASETGWAFMDSEEALSLKYGSFKIPTRVGTQKWKWYYETVSVLCKVFQPELIVVEMPVINHVGATIHHAKLVVLIELMCQVNGGLIYKEVPPNMIKKRFTDKGNAEKHEMLSASRMLGYDGDNHNVADALLILFYQLTEM